MLNESTLSPQPGRGVRVLILQRLAPARGQAAREELRVQSGAPHDLDHEIVYVRHEELELLCLRCGCSKDLDSVACLPGEIYVDRRVEDLVRVTEVLEGVYGTDHRIELIECRIGLLRLEPIPELLDVVDVLGLHVL